VEVEDLTGGMLPIPGFASADGGAARIREAWWVMARFERQILMAN
jgi:hypothetical protein